MKGSGENVLKVDDQPGYLGNFPEKLDDEDLDDEEIARRDALLEKEIKDFIIEAEESSKGGGGESNSVHARVETKPKPAERNRKITKLRVASYGPTKGCDACKYGTDYHTKECRSRSNTLLEGEPIKAPKTPVVSVPKTPVESHEPKVGEGPSSSAVGGRMMTMNLRLMVMLVRLRMLWVLLASRKGLKFQLNPNFWREVPMLRHQS